MKIGIATIALLALLNLGMMIQVGYLESQLAMARHDIEAIRWIAFVEAHPEVISGERYTVRQPDILDH